MPAPDAEADGNSAAATDSSLVLNKLPDAQAFSRDPEDYTTEALSDTIARLERILARQRKARQDAAEVAEAAAKMKKANAANRKAKAKKSGALLEQTV